MTAPIDEETERNHRNRVDLSVIVPVFNNAGTLDELIRRIVAIVAPITPRFELVFVDDGSQDRSVPLLREWAVREPRIRTVRLTRNFASQAAVCAGLERMRGRRGVILDADLENWPEDIPALLAPLDDGYDLVCGYRTSRPVARSLPSALMNFYVRRRSGVTIRDIGCAMRAFDAAVVRNLELEGERRRLLSPLFLSRARRVTEVPIRSAVRTASGGHSFLTLLAIAADYYLITAKRPFLVSGLVAAVASVVGAVTLVAWGSSTGLIVLTGGLLGLPISLIGEYVQKLYNLAQGHPFYEVATEEAETEPPGPDQVTDASQR